MPANRTDCAGERLDFPYVPGEDAARAGRAGADLPAAGGRTASQGRRGGCPLDSLHRNP